MLLNTFFKITDIQETEGDKKIISIELNPHHEVYKGHFPGNPIAPGVCLTQMVKETVEFITKKNLTMVTGDNLKFTAILNPEVHPNITMALAIKTKDNGNLQADSVVTAEGTTFFTIKASYKEI